MTEINQIWKCNICGNIVELVHPGSDSLVCCGKPMTILQAKTKDQGYEKHVPVIEKTESGVLIKVGSIPHPMLPEHFIEWIELIADGKVYKKFLNPGDKPEAEFSIQAKSMFSRIYCNIHGLWRSQ